MSICELLKNDYLKETKGLLREEKLDIQCPKKTKIHLVRRGNLISHTSFSLKLPSLEIYVTGKNLILLQNEC
jgi:hypothetical protein